MNNAFGQFNDDALAEFHEAMAERFDFAFNLLSVKTTIIEKTN